jgi:hypothetical protein
MEVDNPGKKKFNGSVETLTKLWKERYAKKRITNKINELSDEITFYDYLYGKEFKEFLNG